MLDEGKRAGEKRPEEPPPYDPESEALAPVVTGRIPALFLTYNEATIHNALEYGFWPGAGGPNSPEGDLFARIAARLGQDPTLRPRGRPRKQPEESS